MIPLVIITGPTAVGKTDLSVQLANRINGEIISADSMQVYKGMDIGSAKITKEEMMGINHYLIDILDPKDEFNVAIFKEYAEDAIKRIISKGKIPIIAGGTGFYIQALLYDVDFCESKGELTEYRKELEKRAENEGPDNLFEELIKIDPESANIIHKNNIKRVIRALEFYHETGKPISLHNKEQHDNESPYNFAYFVLNDLRDKVYERINLRVNKMIDDGLLDEVKRLMDSGLDKSYNSMQGIGYKEIIDYYNGEYPLEDALEIVKRDTRHFAKRQITWFKREKNVIWLERNLFNNDSKLLLDYIINVLKDKGIYNE